MAKVDTSADGCWPWTGAINGDAGYGHLWFERRLVYAHRFSYELAVGPIPPGFEIDHLCRTPACVRPSHLEPVTHAENIRRAFRGPLCKRGHHPSRVSVRPNGTRECLACAAVRRFERGQVRQEGYSLALPSRDVTD